MSDLKDGNFHIILAGISGPPPFPVGADEGGATSPVISGGKDNVWTATKLPSGRYTLILEQTGSRWLSKAGDDEVFVALMPLPEEWVIRKHEGDTYSIEVPGIISGPYWNLTSTEIGTPVTLVRRDFPPLWRFHQVPINK